MKEEKKPTLKKSANFKLNPEERKTIYNLSERVSK